MKKRTFKFIILISLFIAILPLFIFKSKAEEKYPFSCNFFEVSYIEDDGSFRSVACYDDFLSAKKKMQELGGDHVVRSRTSYSPSKIIAMNSGIAYAYPGRNNMATLNIYQDLYERSIYKKSTYVSHYYTLYYHDTALVLKDGGKGMVYVTLNGFKGYTDLEYVDLVPTKFLKHGLSIWLGGNNSYFQEKAYKIIVQYNYFRKVRNGKYLDLEFVYHLAFPNKNSLYNEEHSLIVGPAPSFMQENKRYYSMDGIHYFVDSDFKEAVGTDYSYYQWLPLRSKTSISSTSLDAHLKEVRSNYQESKMYQKAQCFIDNQNIYGINALLTYALGAHESNYGLSNFALSRNNLFGWKAYDASPGSAMNFSSIEKSISEHMGINLRGYCDITEGRFFGPSLGNKGAGLNVKYASDPYWGMKIAGIAYRADKASNNYNGNLTDYNRYKLALINNFSTPFLKGPFANSEVLYTSEYGPTYQQDFIVIAYEKLGDYTKIQGTNIVGEDGKVYTHLTPPSIGEVNPAKPYDFDRSLAYIKTNNLTLLSSGETLINYKKTINYLNWDGELFNIVGTISSDNVLSLNETNNRAEIVISGDKEYNYKLELKEDKGKVVFDEKIDLNNLEIGQYNIHIKSAFNNNKENNDEILSCPLPRSVVINNKLFNLTYHNRKLLLEISAVKDKQKAISSVKNIKLEDDYLSFSGVGIIEGLAAKNKDDIQYEVVLRNRQNISEEYSFKAKTIDAQGFSLNDGIDYHYGAYRAKISLDDIIAGNYSIHLKIKYQGLTKLVPLQNSRVENREKSVLYNNKTYHLLANELYNYAFEFDIFNAPLPFDKINKPSARRSLVSYDKFKINDHSLVLDAHALIYYLDYPQDNNAFYQVWAVSKNNYHTFNVYNSTCEVDFNSTLLTKNNSTNICFNSSLDLSSLGSGQYYLYVTIFKDGFYDIIPLTNRGHRKTPSEGKYAILTNEYSHQVYIKVD